MPRICFMELPDSVRTSCSQRSGSEDTIFRPSLAGVASAMFWYPVVYFTHSLNLFPSSFIVADLAVRALGSAVGNGLLGAAIGVVILKVARRIRNNSVGASLEPTKQTVRPSYSDSKFRQINLGRRP